MDTPKSKFVRVKNDGNNPFPVGREMLYPGDTTLVSRGLYEAKKILHPELTNLTDGEPEIPPASEADSSPGTPPQSGGQGESSVPLGEGTQEDDEPEPGPAGKASKKTTRGRKG